MNQNRPKKHLLAIGLVIVTGGLACRQGFAQGTSAAPKAQQVPVSQSAGTVEAQQSTTGSAGSSSSVNTINSTIQIAGPFQGSIPDPKVPPASLALTIADAISRGLRFNLGGVSANVSVRQARAQRLAALSLMLPNIYASLNETSAKIDLQHSRRQRLCAHRRRHPHAAPQLLVSSVVAHADGQHSVRCRHVHLVRCTSLRAVSAASLRRSDAPRYQYRSRSRACLGSNR